MHAYALTHIQIVWRLLKPNNKAIINDQDLDKHFTKDMCEWPISTSKDSQHSQKRERKQIMLLASSQTLVTAVGADFTGSTIAVGKSPAWSEVSTDLCRGVGRFKGHAREQGGEPYGLEPATKGGVDEEQKEGLVDRTRPPDLVSQPLPRGETDLPCLYHRGRWCWRGWGPSEAGPSPPTGTGSERWVVPLRVCLSKKWLWGPQENSFRW